MDGLPILSQIKSAAQAAFGDKKGARETQINFSRRCPVISQIRSAVEAARGNQLAARETQKECGTFLLSFVEGTPGVGHAIGTIYYIAGNRKKGDETMKMASRSTAVIIGGAVGFIMGGPVPAAVGGAAGGVAMDGIISGIDFAVHKNLILQGVFAPAQDPKNVGKWLDAIFLIGIDSFTGFAVGRAVGIGRAAAAKGFIDNVVANPKSAVAELLNNAKGDVRSVITNKSVFGTQLLNDVQNIFKFKNCKTLTFALRSSAFGDVNFTKITIKCLKIGFQFYKELESTALGGMVITAVTQKMKRELHSLIKNECYKESKHIKGIFSPYGNEPEFSRISESLESLNEIDQSKEDDEDTIDQSTLDLNAITFEEIFVKGRKLYVVSYAQTQTAEKSTIRRWKSCYF